MNDIIDVTTIRKLNDQFRQSLRGGVLVMTAGVIALGQDRQLKILEAVVQVRPLRRGQRPVRRARLWGAGGRGERLFFKIDYYDQDLSAHSPDPADPSVTKRVLTIMLAEEY